MIVSKHFGWSPRVALVSLSLLGCAANGGRPAVAPFRVRASDWGTGARPTNARPAPGQPIIVDFKTGDRIPVVIQVDGEIVETTPSPSTVWLTAKRDFSVRIAGSDVKTSLDGVHFDEKPTEPGHFQFGFELTREGGGKVVARLTTPQHGPH